MTPEYEQKLAILNENKDFAIFNELSDVNDKLEKIVDREAPETMSVKLEGVSVLTIKGDKGEDGEDGEDGKTPTEDELLTLIRPLIPKVENGKTPTKEELLVLIRPLIPKVENGKTPTDEYLLSLIVPLIPIVKNGKDGSPDTPDQVIDKVNASSKKIKKERVEGLEQAIQNSANNAVGGITTSFFNGKRAKNLNITGTALASVVQDGDTVTITVNGGAGSGDVVGPASATDNNIAVFDLTTGKLIKDGGATVASLAAETATTIGALIGGAGDATPNDTDFVATSLTAGGILKKITWTNVKAFLKTYFDTLYATIGSGVTSFNTRTGAVIFANNDIVSAQYCGTAGGTANAITLTPNPAITAYADGQTFVFKALATTTTASTININGLGAINTTMGGGAVPAGDILIGKYYFGMVESSGTAIRIAGYDSVSVNGDTILGQLKFTGTAPQIKLGTESGNTGTIQFANSANANLVSLRAGASASTFTFTLPTSGGSNGQVMKTDGAGVLSFTDGSGISGLGTSDSPQFTGVNIGHATDTTITRASAGVIAVEGVAQVSVAGATMTGALVTADHGTATNPEVVSVVYGTGTAPTASTTPIGTLFVKYTA